MSHVLLQLDLLSRPWSGLQAIVHSSNAEIRPSNLLCTDHNSFASRWGRRRARLTKAILRRRHRGAGWMQWRLTLMERMYHDQEQQHLHHLPLSLPCNMAVHISDAT